MTSLAVFMTRFCSTTPFVSVITTSDGNPLIAEAIVPLIAEATVPLIAEASVPFFCLLFVLSCILKHLSPNLHLPEERNK